MYDANYIKSKYDSKVEGICIYVQCHFLQRTLEQEAKKCQHLILWTDGDREGENIAWEIAEVCKKGKFVSLHYIPQNITESIQNFHLKQDK